MKSKQIGCGRKADPGQLYRPSGESFQGFEQRRNNSIVVIRAQEMFYERHFKAYAQNEKNSP